MRRKSSLFVRFLVIFIVACFIYPALYFQVVRFSSKDDIPNLVKPEITGTRGRRSVNTQNNSVHLFNDQTPKVNCVEPSIDEFPSDFMTQYQRQKQGGVLVHILIALYMFGALAIVCDGYFVASLERICEDLNLKSDVAGATFMAVGSSAPEFFTSVIGVFITKGDIGLGTIVGSAVFNILFIVAVCGLFAGCVLKISCWPLTRDSVCYMLSVAALVVVTYDQKVYWYEGMILVTMYCLYVVVMYFNTSLEAFFTGFKGDSTKKGTKEEGESLMDNEEQKDSSSLDDKDESKEVEVVSFGGNADSDDSPLTMPEGVVNGILWIFFLPISFLLYISIPDCRNPRWNRCYFATFLISVLWIAGLSYILVWMVEIIGFTLQIPDVVMGLTFLAAGSSVPDGISSLIVARQGDGDMAVSNCIGSNVFDILLCLGLPWLLKTTVVDLGSHVNVISGSIIYTSLSLFGTVVVTVLIIRLNRWKLNRLLGVIFLFLYIIFISVATLFELNVLGSYNLPVC